MDIPTPLPGRLHQGAKVETYPPGPNMAPAMAYIMVQPRIAQVYYTDIALKQGTLFPELDKPFTGSRGTY